MALISALFNLISAFSDESKQRLFVRKPSSRRSPVDQFISLPCQIAAYLAAHTFGIRMVFPGSISLLGYIMGKYHTFSSIHLLMMM